jgi:hypothetical protein
MRRIGYFGKGTRREVGRRFKDAGSRVKLEGCLAWSRGLEDDKGGLLVHEKDLMWR